jgi:hypothetical protein
MNKPGIIKLIKKTVPKVITPLPGITPPKSNKKLKMIDLFAGTGAFIQYVIQTRLSVYSLMI